MVLIKYIYNCQELNCPFKTIKFNPFYICVAVQQSSNSDINSIIFKHKSRQYWSAVKVWIYSAINRLLNTTLDGFVTFMLNGFIHVSSYIWIHVEPLSVLMGFFLFSVLWFEVCKFRVIVFFFHLVLLWFSSNCGVFLCCNFFLFSTLIIHYT